LGFKSSFKTTSIWEKLFGAGVLFYLAFALFGFWYFDYLPFRDWYDWVLEGQILAHHSEPRFNPYYQVVKSPVPNSFASFFLYLCSGFLSPEQAGRLWLSLSFLTFIFGFWYCANRLSGKNSFRYLGLFLVWNHWFLIGNLNQHFGLGIFLFALGRLGAKEPGFTRQQILELNLWCLLLYFIHFTVYGAFLIFLFFWLWEKERQILKSGFKLIFGAGISLIFLAWFSWKVLSGENLGRLFSWYHPLYHFYGWIYTLLPFASGGLKSSPPQSFIWLNLFYLLFIHLLVFGGMAFWLYKYSSDSPTEKNLLRTSAVFFIIWVMAPFQLGKCNGFNFRFGFLFVLIGLILISKKYQRYLKNLTKFISLGIGFAVLLGFFSQTQKIQADLSQLDQFLKPVIKAGKKSFGFIIYESLEKGWKRKLAKYYYPQAGIVAYQYLSGGCYPAKFETGLILKTEKCPSYPTTNLETNPARFFKEQLNNLARDFDSLILVGRIEKISRFVPILAKRFQLKKKSDLTIYLEREK